MWVGGDGGLEKERRKVRDKKLMIMVVDRRKQEGEEGTWSVVALFSSLTRVHKDYFFFKSCVIWTTILMITFKTIMN